MNPWLIVAGLIALIAVGSAGVVTGKKLERVVWQEKVAAQKAEANRKLIAAYDQIIEEALSYSRLRVKTETDYGAAIRKIDEVSRSNLALLTDNRNLRFAVARRGDGGRRPESSEAGAPSVSSGAAPACELRGEDVVPFYNLARDADVVAAYAMSCYEWVKAVSEPPPEAPAR